MERPPLLFRRLAKWQLRRILSARQLDSVLQAAEATYEPPARLAQTPGGRLNLEMTAYLLALRDGMVATGWDEATALDVLAQSLYRVMRRIYVPLEVAARLHHPLDRRARGLWRQRFAARFFFRPPDWIMEPLVGSPCYAFDVRRCLVADYARSRNEANFCERVLCSQDFLMAAGRGERLERRMTLAGGAERCDFRFPELTPAGESGLRSHAPAG